MDATRKPLTGVDLDAAIASGTRKVATEWEYLLNDLDEACDHRDYDHGCPHCRRYKRADALLDLFRDTMKEDQ